MCYVSLRNVNIKNISNFAFQTGYFLISMADLKIALEFGGGAEVLVGNQKVHEVAFPSKNKVWTIGDLLYWIKDNILKERPELFLQDGSV
ncbi:unnamed protein product [Acanthoscelides obtectus]|nr:unnamed protein product [Acanthoscelides obtectus]CAK1673131.1 Ubiquitin-related modifier 1 [Acanthoscelides obtectus]